MKYSAPENEISYEARGVEDIGASAQKLFRSLCIFGEGNASEIF